MKIQIKENPVKKEDIFANLPVLVKHLTTDSIWYVIKKNESGKGVAVCFKESYFTKAGEVCEHLYLDRNYELFNGEITISNETN